MEQLPIHGVVIIQIFVQDLVKQHFHLSQSIVYHHLAPRAIHQLRLKVSVKRDGTVDQHQQASMNGQILYAMELPVNQVNLLRVLVGHQRVVRGHGHVHERMDEKILHNVVQV